MNNKILVPVVTPFKKDESVDHEALKKLVRFVLDSGADGIYAGGSSAECFLMSEEERMAALETVVKAADGAFVIANIGTVGSIPAETLAAHAEKAGANAVSSVPPFYFRFSFDEIAAYYHDLARKTKLPMMIYNIPDLTNNGRRNRFHVQLHGEKVYQNQRAFRRQSHERSPENTARRERARALCVRMRPDRKHKIRFVIDGYSVRTRPQTVQKADGGG